MRYLIALFLLCLVGCTVSVDSDSKYKYTSLQKNPCVVAGASYKGYFTELAGNCGPIESQTLTVPYSGIIQLPAPCKNLPYYRECTTFMENIECLHADYDMIEVSSGYAKWSSDGSSADGTITIRLEDRNKNVLCLSKYDVHYERVDN